MAKRGWLNDNRSFRGSDGQREDNITTFIIDESSMIDLPMLATLFKAINWNAVQRLLFVGDPNQLPPIGTGKVFSDLLDWLNVELPEHVGELTTNIRQIHNRITGKGTGILDLANKYLPEAETMKTLVGFVKNLQKKYEMYKYLVISDKPDKDGFFNVEIKPELNSLSHEEAREGYKQLIFDVGVYIEGKTNLSFIEDFRNELDDEDKIRVNKFKIPLDDIEEELWRNSFEIIAYKIFEVLIELMGSKTSISYAVTTIETILKKLQDKHEVLGYIIIDSSKYSEGIKAISIQPEIRNVETHKLGRGLKEIIKLLQDSIGERTFIRDFKDKLGENLVQKVEKMGVNLHVLELRAL